MKVVPSFGGVYAGFGAPADVAGGTVVPDGNIALYRAIDGSGFPAPAPPTAFVCAGCADVDDVEEQSSCRIFLARARYCDRTRLA
jgi:hypothetical protein